MASAQKLKLKYMIEKMTTRAPAVLKKTKTRISTGISQTGGWAVPNLEIRFLIKLDKQFLPNQMY